ncbi:zinc finger BED domain-containing protein 5-like [Palaemon carinicauda]|uniref:zinc finger BED domain-containing protein 5-like n=1 Tax=Palaemon carinicauda TaxID=392227 RepID=UPI0035B5B3BE
MSEDVKQQVIAELKEASLGKFAIQLDESTDVADCAQLLLFVRYVTGQDFKEEFLFCHTLNTTTRGSLAVEGECGIRVDSLKEELTEFFKCDNKAKSLEFTKKLSDSQWLQKLAYLSDIFLRLNSFKLSLQGRFATVSDFMDKLRSLTMKPELWEGKVKDGNLSMFEHLGETLDKSQNTGKQDVMQLVQSHLASLRMELQSYFPELSELESKLIRNPFIVNVHLLPDNMQEEFLELVNDSVAKDAFETLSLTKFWAKMSEIYPVVSKVVLNSLLMFPSTYLSEQGFSTLLNMKTKHRSRLNVEHDLRLCLSNTAPRIEKLVCNRQAQPSH